MRKSSQWNEKKKLLDKRQARRCIGFARAMPKQIEDSAQCETLTPTIKLIYCIKIYCTMKWRDRCETKSDQAVSKLALTNRALPVAIRNFHGYNLRSTTLIYLPFYSTSTIILVHPLVLSNIQQEIKWHIQLNFQLIVSVYVSFYQKISSK